MTTVKKVVVANYSEDMLAAIIADYQAFIVDFQNDNTAILHTLSTKYGKSVHSLRAKLASLKVYKTANLANNGSKISKEKKEDIVKSISYIVGVELSGLEVAPKNTLLALLSFVSNQRDKIEQLIADLTEEGDV